MLIAEGLWSNKTHLDGKDINILTGVDAVSSYGGMAFYDNKIWLHRD